MSNPENLNLTPASLKATAEYREWVKAGGPLCIGQDEYPPGRKRLLLIQTRTELPSGYVIAAESIEQRIEAAKAHYELIVEAVNSHEALKEEVALLRSALKRFGEHNEDCRSNERYPSPPCDCGLGAALKGEE